MLKPASVTRTLIVADFNHRPAIVAGLVLPKIFPSFMTDLSLLMKYNVPVPRYTSYPTVPYWKEGIDVHIWKQQFISQFRKYNRTDGISLYIHLPFCESLCTYCGCNKKITTNHSVEDDYIDAIIKEWQLYLQLTDEKPLVRELHLGGGTPTFFSPQNLNRLISTILKETTLHPEHEFSFEGHPNNTTREHLQELYDLGFRRVSFGVQDNNPDVQLVINRIQPFENVARVTAWAREIGYHSVNFDLIYGLPLQNAERIRQTLQQCISLRPDRVAFYSYAHVPWTSRGQRLFDETHLPSAAEKMELYLIGRGLFTRAGYTDIGMDHFALPGDDLYKMWQCGKLHRNFMGYTTQKTSMLIGLGVSSISDIGIAYAQNNKTLHDYYHTIAAGELPLVKGCFLSDEDLVFKKYILDISCNGLAVFEQKSIDMLKPFVFPELERLSKDGLISWNESGLRVTSLGRNFIRNICSAFDLHMLRSKSAADIPKFSKAI